MIVLNNKKGKERVFLNKTELVLMNSLKGRISKILNISSILTPDEKESLTLAYLTIDKAIINELTKPCEYLGVLKSSSKNLEKSKKAYIKKHIVPLMNKISIKKWGKDV